MPDKLESFLKYLEEKKEDYRKPVFYQEEDWYIRCEAKADILEDLIAEVKSFIKETNE